MKTTETNEPAAPAPAPTPSRHALAARRSAAQRRCPACDRRGALRGYETPPDPFWRFACRWCGWDGTWDEKRRLEAERRKRNQTVRTPAGTTS